MVREQQRSPRSQHPGHVFHSGTRIGETTQREGTHHGIEGFVPERQLRPVGLQQLDFTSGGGCASSRQLQHALTQVHSSQLHLRRVVRQIESAPYRNLEDLPHRPFAHPPAARHQITLLHPCHPLVVTSRGSVPVTPHSFRSHGFRVPDVPAERRPPPPGINTCAHRLSETQASRSAIRSGTMSRDGPATGATRPALVWSGHRARGIPETRRIRSSSTVGKAHITGTRRTSPSFQAVPIRRQSPCFSALEGWRDFGSPAAEHRAALDFTR